MGTNALVKKLLELQKALALVRQDARGEGYKYASGEQVLGIARPKMDELGLLLLQEITEMQHEHVLWKTSKGDKQQTYVHAKFRFHWIDTESGETLVQLFEADGFNNWDKAAGSAMTYAERYFFMKTFHIPTDDLDPNQREENGATKASAPKAEKTDDQKRSLIAGWIMEMEGGDLEKAKARITELTAFEADDETNPGQKKVIPGVKGTAELKDKRLNATYGKIKTMYEAWKKGQE